MASEVNPLHLIYEKKDKKTQKTKNIQTISFWNGCYG